MDTQTFNLVNRKLHACFLNRDSQTIAAMIEKMSDGEISVLSGQTDLFSSDILDYPMAVQERPEKDTGVCDW